MPSWQPAGYCTPLTQASLDQALWDTVWRSSSISALVSISAKGKDFWDLLLPLDAKLPFKSLILYVRDTLTYYTHIHIPLFKWHLLSLAWLPQCSNGVLLLSLLCGMMALANIPWGSLLQTVLNFPMYGLYKFERQDFTWHNVQTDFMG